MDADGQQLLDIIPPLRCARALSWQFGTGLHGALSEAPRSCLRKSSMWLQGLCICECGSRAHSQGKYGATLDPPESSGASGPARQSVSRCPFWALADVHQPAPSSPQLSVGKISTKLVYSSHERLNFEQGYISSRRRRQRRIAELVTLVQDLERHADGVRGEADSLQSQIGTLSKNHLRSAGRRPAFSGPPGPHSSLAKADWLPMAQVPRMRNFWRRSASWNGESPPSMPSTKISPPAFGLPIACSRRCGERSPDRRYYQEFFLQPLCNGQLRR